MKQIHHIWLTIYVKPEDNESDVLMNLNKFIPLNLEEEKLIISKEIVSSVQERKITIFQIHLEKTKHINEFMKKLNSILTEQQKKLILKQIESRLDTQNNFFLRFDKKKLIDNNEFNLTDLGNCYHIKMSMAAFPGTRENALKIIPQLFP